MPEARVIEISMSKHADTRRRQRGITLDRFAGLLAEADIDRPIGSNCRLIGVSRRAAAAIRGGERFARLRAIVNDTTGEIITLLHVSSTGRGKRYR